MHLRRRVRHLPAWLAAGPVGDRVWPAHAARRGRTRHLDGWGACHRDRVDQNGLGGLRTPWHRTGHIGRSPRYCPPVRLCRPDGGRWGVPQRLDVSSPHRRDSFLGVGLGDGAIRG